MGITPIMAELGYRSAFITGASSGIGAALAKRLAQSGIEVGLAARRETELAVLAEEIRAAGGRAKVYPLDVTDAPAVTRTVLRADEELGGLDLVIANAGVGKSRWSGKLSWEDCEPTLQVNVIGATATLLAAVPAMVERGRGHLVGVSSLAAYRGLPKNAVYSASKAYLSILLEGLRIDLASAEIAVTDIRPGYVKTAMTEGNKKMPFLLEAEGAAREIMDAIAARKDVHAFPFPMAMGMRSVASLPNAIYDRLVNRVV